MSNQIGSLKMDQKFKKTPAGEIPVDWECASLSSVANIIMGQSPESSACNDKGKGVPFYQGNADFGRLYPVPSSWCTSPTKLAKEGDILISVRAPVGEINIAPHNCCVGRGLSAIRPTEADCTYLYYSLFSSSQAFDKLAQGSTFKAINGGDLTDLPIALPSSRHEQEKIGQILWAIDENIGKTIDEIEKTKELKNGLMLQLFSRGVGHKKFKKTPVGEIPIEWGLVELGDVCAVTKLAGFEYTKYFQYKKDGEIIALRALNIKGEELDLSDVQTIDLAVSNGLLRSKLFEGDVVITYIGNIGDVLRIPESNKYHLAPNIAKITPTAEYHSWFLLRVLQSNIGQRQLRSLTATTAMPSLTMQQIRKIVLPKPSPAEQDEITNILSVVVDNIKRQEEGLSKLLGLRTAIMRVLLTGKVRVI